MGNEEAGLGILFAGYMERIVSDLSTDVIMLFFV